MKTKVVSISGFKKKRSLQQSLHTDIDLIHAFHQARRLHKETQPEPEDAIVHIQDGGTETWFQRRLANAVFERELYDASVMLMTQYVATLLVSYRGRAWGETTPLQRLSAYLETNNPHELLHAAEDSFFAFCFFPEIRPRREVAYRTQAREVGIIAYHAYGRARSNPLGTHMERAFVPLGELVRELFVPNK